MATYKIVKSELKLTIRVPKGTQWDFMKEFGNLFEDSNTHPKPVDSYNEDGLGCYITVSIFQIYQETFENFCNKFFSARGIIKGV